MGTFRYVRVAVSVRSALDATSAPANNNSTAIIITCSTSYGGSANANLASDGYVWVRRRCSRLKLASCSIKINHVKQTTLTMLLIYCGIEQQCFGGWAGSKSFFRYCTVLRDVDMNVSVLIIVQWLCELNTAMFARRYDFTEWIKGGPLYTSSNRMGAQCTTVNGSYKEAKLRSEEIDRQLNQFATQESSVSKILLLGKCLSKNTFIL